jgi:hypothetical protein
VVEHPNAKRLVQAIASFNERDPEGVLAMWTENPLFHVPVRGPHGGDYRGRDGVRQLMELVLRLSNGTYQLELVDVLADDRYGVAVIRITASKDEASSDFELAYSVKFDDQGRQAEAWLLASDRAAYESLFA